MASRQLKLPDDLAEEYVPVSIVDADPPVVALRIRRTSDGSEYELRIYPAGKRLDERLNRARQRMDPRHLVRLVRWKDDGPSPYEMVEYLPGGNLQKILDEYPAGAPRQIVADVVAEIADALRELHDAGYVHYDLTPGKVLIRTREPLDLVLSPDYGHARRADTDPTADLYALGSLTAELAGGRQADLSSIRDPRVRELCRGLLAPDPDKRWGFDEVSRWLATERVPIAEAVTVTELNQQTTAVLRRVKAGRVLPVTERGKVIAYLTPPPPTVTGNPTIDRWIAEGRLVPAAVPGTVLDLLPLPEEDDGPSLADSIVAERDREAGDE